MSNGPYLTISPDKLAGAFMREATRQRKAMRTAAMRAARRYVAWLRKHCDDLGLTDRGLFKRSIRAVAWKLGAMVFADAPHAGVIEGGARPHPVSAEGRANIANWARRKLGVPAKEADHVAYAIALKIAKEGQEPKWVFRNSMHIAYKFYKDELYKLGIGG